MECLVAATLLSVTGVTLPSLVLSAGGLLDRHVLRMKALEFQTGAVHAVLVGACGQVAPLVNPPGPRLWHERTVMVHPGGVEANLTTGWSGASRTAEPSSRLRWIVVGRCE